MEPAQFKEFMEALLQANRHWELLIRIDENTKNLRDAMNKHVSEDSAEFAVTKQSLTKVHERIDNIKKDFAVDMKSIEIQISAVDDQLKKFKNRVIGAMILATFIVTSVQFGINIYNGTREIGRRASNESPLRNS